VKKLPFSFPILPVVSVVVVMIAAGCGSSSSNPTAPDTGAPGPSGATMTIGANGVLSPKDVTITRGQSVTIVNNDTRVHEMTSDPHPNHTDCPAINAVGLLQPGQSKLTNALSTARTCGLHDHMRDTDTNLQGRITIQ
jgi:hypothetical protein